VSTFRLRFGLGRFDGATEVLVLAPVLVLMAVAELSVEVAGEVPGIEAILAFVVVPFGRKNEVWRIAEEELDDGAQNPTRAAGDVPVVGMKVGSELLAKSGDARPMKGSWVARSSLALYTCRDTDEELASGAGAVVGRQRWGVNECGEWLSSPSTQVSDDDNDDRQDEEEANDDEEDDDEE